MKRTREDSRIEIWGTNYINSIDARYPDDQDAQIIQIEPSSNPGDYIVEVVKKEDE